MLIVAGCISDRVTPLSVSSAATSSDRHPGLEPAGHVPSLARCACGQQLAGGRHLVALCVSAPELPRSTVTATGAAASSFGSNAISAGKLSNRRLHRLSALLEHDGDPASCPGSTLPAEPPSAGAAAASASPIGTSPWPHRPSPQSHPSAICTGPSPGQVLDAVQRRRVTSAAIDTTEPEPGQHASMTRRRPRSGCESTAWAATAVSPRCGRRCKRCMACCRAASI